MICALASLFALRLKLTNAAAGLAPLVSEITIPGAPLARRAL